MARQHWISGDYSDMRRDESIVRICKQALSFDANYAQAWALMALAEAQLRFFHGRKADPLRAAERAIEINPNLAEAHCVMAQLLAEQGKVDDANFEIDEAFRLDPASWEVNREAARLIFRQGRVSDAIPYYERAAELMPSDWHSPMMLTTCYESAGNSDAALRSARSTIERAEKAVAKDPANTQALAAGANALAMLAEEGRARDWIDRALLLDPDNTLTRYNLGCALACRLNDTERALEVLKPFFEQEVSITQIKHLEVDPDLDTIRGETRFQEMLLGAKERLGMTS
jgi:adenylate cyclase